MAQIVDPWGGFNEGIQNLNQSLSDIRRQKAVDLELESRGLQNKTAAVQLQDLLLKQQQNQELRNAMAAPAETVTDTQFVPSQVSPSVDMLNRMPGQQAAPVSPFTPEQAQQPSVFNTPGEIKSTTKEKPIDFSKIAYDVYTKQGRITEANEALEGKIRSLNLTQLAAEHEAQAKLGNGDPVEAAMNKQKLAIVADMTTHILPLLKNPATKQLGRDMMQRYIETYPFLAATFNPKDIDVQNDNIVQEVKDPKSGVVIGRHILRPDGTWEFHAPSGAENAHNTVKITSSDGKKERTMQYNTETQKYDKPIDDWHTPVSTNNANIRIEGLGKMRMYSVLDSKNGNRPMMLSAEDLAEANLKEPGRYMPSGPAGKALGQTSLIEDIRGNVNDTREVVKKIKGNFSKGLVAQLSLASNSNHPEAIIGNLVKSTAMEKLTPEEQEYLINLNLLIENGMAMRSVLGAGQGSDELRSAIKATLPNAKSPNADYVKMQLDKFEKTLNRLSRGVPNVDLKPTAIPPDVLNRASAALKAANAKPGKQFTFSAHGITYTGKMGNDGKPVFD